MTIVVETAMDCDVIVEALSVVGGDFLCVSAGLGYALFHEAAETAEEKAPKRGY